MKRLEAGGRGGGGWSLAAHACMQAPPPSPSPSASLPSLPGQHHTALPAALVGMPATTVTGTPM
jgi:hypothetical protein